MSDGGPQAFDAGLDYFRQEKYSEWLDPCRTEKRKPLKSLFFFKRWGADQLPGTPELARSIAEPIAEKNLFESVSRRRNQLLDNIWGAIKMQNKPACITLTKLNLINATKTSFT